VLAKKTNKTVEQTIIDALYSYFHVLVGPDIR
jgi:hypothetical protein